MSDFLSEHVQVIAVRLPPPKARHAFQGDETECAMCGRREEAHR